MRKSFDSYIMSLCYEVATRSTCLRRNIGAIIVKGQQVISCGFNGAPTGYNHCTECRRKNIPSGQQSELCVAAHAEQNAINFAARYGTAIEGATIYTTHFPCSWCAKSIVNAGIIEVVYDQDYPDKLAKDILKSVKVKRHGRSDNNV